MSRDSILKGLKQKAVLFHLSQEIKHFSKSYGKLKLCVFSREAWSNNLLLSCRTHGETMQFKKSSQLW